MSRTVVIGIGNIFMRDDGIGVKVADAIKEELLNHNISVIIGETDFWYCKSQINSDDFLIVIDAVYTGAQVGSISVIPLKEALTNLSIHNQHEISLFNLLAIYYPEIDGYLIGIEVGEINFGDDFSCLLQDNFKHICAITTSLILNLKTINT